MKTSSQLFQDLIDTIHILRSQNGCPWDRKQTNVSLIKYLREESSELIEAVGKTNPDDICEEIGDLQYILLLLCVINEDNNLFTTEKMLSSIIEKLIRRHPHVFSGEPVVDEDELKKQWEAIKAKEKREK